jgi:hypothetical protein
MKLKYVALLLILLFVIISCSNPLNLDNQSLIRESRLFADSDEMSASDSKALGDYVPTEIALLFARGVYKQFISDDKIDSQSVLSEKPIVIYNSDGEKLYYEYRAYIVNIIDFAVTIVAKKTMGYPISYEFTKPNNYSASLLKVLSVSPLKEDEVIRVVADNYPDYEYVKFCNDSLKSIKKHKMEFFDSRSGVFMPQDKIAKSKYSCDALSNFSDDIPLADQVKIRDNIKRYTQNVASFWSQLSNSDEKLPNEIELRSGDSENAKDIYEYGILDKYSSSLGKYWNKGWCGPSSINWALGY